MLRRLHLPLFALLLTSSLSACAAVPEGMGIVFRALRGHESSQSTAPSADPGSADGVEQPAGEGNPGSQERSDGVAHAMEPQPETAAEDAPDASDGAQERVVALAPLPSQTPLPSPTPEPSPTLPPTSTPDPMAAAGQPTRLEIPAIGVDAPVELVGLTPERAMDVPKGWMNAGWYRNGFLPGELGNSVIAGHLDTSTGGPAVFWDLGQLVPGDEVHVTYEDGSRRSFVVEASKIYDHDAEGAIIESIFGKSLTADLNLVTCDGAWDHGAATYAKRLVVFTTLMPERTVSAGALESTQPLD